MGAGGDGPERLVEPDRYAALDWLARVRPNGVELPEQVELDIEGVGHVLFCHGSPLNVQEFDYIFARDQAARDVDNWLNNTAAHY
mgnify:CR=1 FL=1